MSIKAELMKEVRLAILQILNEDFGYSINHQMMARALETIRAYSQTDDQIKTHFHWLAEQNCVTVEEAGVYTIARLTDDGMSVATGRKIIPGIARPRPSSL